MIIGIGLDVVEVSRFSASSLDRNDLISELFTPAEIAYCNGKRYPAEHFAARFCAKEALLKALGTGYRDGLSWREMELSNDAAGQPQMALAGKVKDQAERLGVSHVWISLTHTRQIAAAQVILEADNSPEQP